jgi:hypothetical protein
MLASLVGAMGGNLGVKTSYTDAQRVEFHYKDVLNDFVVPAEVGVYLKGAEIDAENPLLREYVLGNGELFVITKTAKSKKFILKYERKNGTDARLDVPAIEQLVGAKVSVGIANELGSAVSFTGRNHLVFGFQCFRLGVFEGDITITSVQAGGAILDVARRERQEADKPFVLNEDGLLDLKFPSTLDAANAV